MTSTPPTAGRSGGKAMSFLKSALSRWDSSANNVLARPNAADATTTLSNSTGSR